MLSAEHTAVFNTQVITDSAGLLAGAGAEADNTITSNVTARVGNNVTVDANDISIGATNRADKPNLGVDNIKGDTGGLASGASAESDTRIAFNTQVLIGNGADLEVQGQPANPGDFELRAFNDFDVYDKVTLTTAGALSGAGAYTDITTTADLARVKIGANANLTSRLT